MKTYGLVIIGLLACMVQSADADEPLPSKPRAIAHNSKYTYVICDNNILYRKESQNSANLWLNIGHSYGNRLTATDEFLFTANLPGADTRIWARTAGPERVDWVVIDHTRGGKELVASNDMLFIDSPENVLYGRPANMATDAGWKNVGHYLEYECLQRKIS